MKKITLSFLVGLSLLVPFTANGQVVSPEFANSEINISSYLENAPLLEEDEVVGSGIKQTITATTLYSIPVGGFYTSLSLTTGKYYSKILHLPAGEIMTYRNATTTKVNWFINNYNVEEYTGLGIVDSDNNYSTIYSTPGTYYLPSISDGTNKYQYGDSFNGTEYPNYYAYVSTPFVGSKYSAITAADLYNEQTLYIGYGASRYTSGTYGTGTIVLNEITYPVQNYYQVYNLPAPLVIEKVRYLLRTESATPIPEGVKLKVDICKATVNTNNAAFYNSGEVLYSTEVSASDFKLLDNSTVVGWLTATFKQDGQDITPVVEGDICVKLSGLEQDGVVFQNYISSDKVRQGYNSDLFASKSYIGFNNNRIIKKSDTPLITLDALYNKMILSDDSHANLYVDNNGGQLKPTTDDFDGIEVIWGWEATDALGNENYEVEKPEWVSTVDCEQVEGDNKVLFNLFADKLPDGVTSREGVVTLKSPGTSVVVNVKQDDGTGTRIKEMNEIVSKIDIFSDAFGLSYSSEFSTVDVYTVAGVRVGSFDLPVNGYFSIDNSTWSAGVYLFYLNGTKTEVIKAIK